MLRTVAVIAALVVTLLSGCAADREPAGSESAVEIEIEVAGDRVEPKGRVVTVQAGVPILLVVTSDRPAELHVHSSPEQVIEVSPGEQRTRLSIDRPGVVDVEEHDTGVVVLRLEVR